jgi:hypothetical protein
MRTVCVINRPQWPYGWKRRSEVARLPRFWGRIRLETRMFDCCVLCCQVEVSATSCSLVQRSIPTLVPHCVWSRNLEEEEEEEEEVMVWVRSQHHRNIYVTKVRTQSAQNSQNTLPYKNDLFDCFGIIRKDKHYSRRSPSICITANSKYFDCPDMIHGILPGKSLLEWEKSLKNTTIRVILGDNGT